MKDRKEDMTVMTNKDGNIQVGLSKGKDLLSQLGTELSEKILEKIFLNIIQSLDNPDKIRENTVLENSQEVRDIMAIDVDYQTYFKKYCTDKNLLEKMDILLYDYQQYLISNNDGRGRRDKVNLFTGGHEQGQPLSIRKLFMDKLSNKKGLGDTI
jgi:hypothetical protein